MLFHFYSIGFKIFNQLFDKSEIIFLNFNHIYKSNIIKKIFNLNKSLN